MASSVGQTLAGTAADRRSKRTLAERKAAFSWTAPHYCELSKPRRAGFLTCLFSSWLGRFGRLGNLPYVKWRCPIRHPVETPGCNDFVNFTAVPVRTVRRASEPVDPGMVDGLGGPSYTTTGRALKRFRRMFTRTL